MNSTGCVCVFMCVKQLKLKNEVVYLPHTMCEEMGGTGGAGELEEEMEEGEMV